jgi:hypothetical protein
LNLICAVVGSADFSRCPQKAWLIGELKAAPLEKALIITMHHSVYDFVVWANSLAGSDAGSPAMGDLLDEAIETSHRHPDVVFSATSNNYERFTRDQTGRQTPYIVIGTGGYWHLHKIPVRAGRAIVKGSTDVTLARYDGRQHGFMRVTVTQASLVGEYFTVSGDGSSDSSSPKLVDSFSLDLKTHRVSSQSLSSPH